MDKKKRVEIHVPESVLTKVTQYQKENGISTLAGTIMDLIRKGLNK